MSGGNYDYAYSKVLDMANDMEFSEFAPKTPLRIAFRGLLERMGAAMRAVEWVDSGDCSEPHAEDAIRSCFSYLQDVNTRLQTKQNIGKDVVFDLGEGYLRPSTGRIEDGTIKYNK